MKRRADTVTIVHFGNLEQLWEYDDDTDTDVKKIRVVGYSFTAILDYTTEAVVKALNEVNENINREYDYRDANVYFEDIEEIIKLYIENHNYTKIE